MNLFKRLFGKSDPPPIPPSTPTATSDLSPDEAGPYGSPRHLLSTEYGDVQIFTILIDQAYNEWKRRFAEIDQTGRYPVIIGREQDLNLITDLREMNSKIQIDPDRLPEAEAILQTRWESMLPMEEELQEEPDFAEAIDTEFPADQLIMRGHPEQQPYRGEEPTMYMALLPVKEGWKAPLLFRNGGWNDYPSDAEHAGLLKRWHEKYGTELVSYRGDLVELRPMTPVRDPEEAKSLAKEWAAYSADNVYQGVGSVKALAEELLGAGLWYSWWD